VVVLLATAFMALGLINLDFSPGWWRGQRLRLLIGVPVLLVYCYLQMPALVFPQAFTLLLLTLVPNAAYAFLLSTRRAMVARRIVSIRRSSFSPYLIALAILGALAAVLAVAPVVDAGGLRDVAAVTASIGLPPNAELKHIRVVPEEAAQFAGEKVIGQLGTYYEVGTYNIQVDGGKLVWVAPLEFHGLIQWLSRRTSPGVIVVSAENPDAGAELRQRAPMRYIPSALLNDNLYRHVYMTYGAEQILETTLQLDDSGNPQYLCTLGRPTIGWTGQKVTAVVIVDPATGTMRRVPREQFASLPHWVSRVYPADLALAYNEWFGLYVHGLWNSMLARRDVHVPARDEVFGLLEGKGTFVWFVDHTSPSRTDQSMTGFTYMDTVDGKITYYTSSGGEFNSAGAENAVASNPIVRQGKLIPTQPILYAAFGQNTWVVPLVADTGKYQTLALVQAKNGHVVVGSAAAPSPQNDAFAQYAAFLGVRTSVSDRQAATTTAGVVHGTIERIAPAVGNALYFTLNGDATIYVLRDAAGSPQALLARSGDLVAFHTKHPSNGAHGPAVAADFMDSVFGR